MTRGFTPEIATYLHVSQEGFCKPMVEELEQEYAALRSKVHDLQEYL